MPLPPGVRPPAGSDREDLDAEVDRLLVRVPRRDGRLLADALVTAQARRNTRHETGPIRVQIDPPTIG